MALKDQATRFADGAIFRTGEPGIMSDGWARTVAKGSSNATYEAEFVLQWLDEFATDQRIAEIRERAQQRRERRALTDYMRSFGCEK